MDIYAEITNRIMNQMENGVIPWRKPWVSSGSCISYASGKPYSLLNQMLLGRPGEYLTFNECRKAGGYVRKGEKASMVVFWTWLEREDEETGEVKNIPFLRYYNVFHIDQCEGLKARHAEHMSQTANADQTAETIIANYLQNSGVTLEHQAGDRAYYKPSADAIVIPLLAQFCETAEYYSTAFHSSVPQVIPRKYKNIKNFDMIEYISKERSRKAAEEFERFNKMQKAEPSEALNVEKLLADLDHKIAEIEAQERAIEKEDAQKEALLKKRRPRYSLKIACRPERVFCVAHAVAGVSNVPFNQAHSRLLASSVEIHFKTKKEMERAKGAILSAGGRVEVLNIEK